MEASKELHPPGDRDEESFDLTALHLIPHQGQLGTEPYTCWPLDIPPYTQQNQEAAKAAELKTREWRHICFPWVLHCLEQKSWEASFLSLSYSYHCTAPHCPSRGTWHKGWELLHFSSLSTLAPKAPPLFSQSLHSISFHSEQLLSPILNESCCSPVNTGLISSTTMHLFLFITFPYQYMKAHCPTQDSFSVSLSLLAAFPVTFFSSHFAHSLPLHTNNINLKCYVPFVDLD